MAGGPIARLDGQWWPPAYFGFTPGEVTAFPCFPLSNPSACARIDPRGSTWFGLAGRPGGRGSDRQGKVSKGQIAAGKLPRGELPRGVRWSKE